MSRKTETSNIYAVSYLSDKKKIGIVKVFSKNLEGAIEIFRRGYNKEIILEVSVTGEEVLFSGNEGNDESRKDLCDAIKSKDKWIEKLMIACKELMSIREIGLDDYKPSEEVMNALTYGDDQ